MGGAPYKAAKEGVGALSVSAFNHIVHYRPSGKFVGNESV